MGSTPHIIITPYRTSCETSDCKTHGCKIWTANRHWHDHVYRVWYTRWFEFEQLCVSQQYEYRHKIESVLILWRQQSIWLDNVSTIVLRRRHTKFLLYGHHVRFGNYIFEVDPQHLYDAYWPTILSDPWETHSSGKRDDKLLATLCDKQRYVIYYRNLQQCTRHGLRIRFTVYCNLRNLHGYAII